ncbi:hypothetical protein [Gordonia sp. VNK21]|uniref:hypothetical protein n=1 Tax=Gordonia sp. VNK21 TaxID=3382483 RepID=UPI0038D41899
MTGVLEAAPATAPIPPAPEAAASPPRLRIPDLAALGAVAGLLGLLPLGVVVKSLLIGAFSLLGPGAAVLTWVRVPRAARLAAIPTVSLALVTLTTITAMWSYRWNVTGILVLGALAVLGSSGYWYASRAAWPDVRRWPARAGAGLRTVATGAGWTVPTALCLVALAIWAAAMPSLPGAEANFYGLVLSGSGVLLIPATVLATIVFLWAVVTRRFGAAVLAVATTIVILRGTTWAGTEVPLYDWTYKHIGVVRYIQEFGHITPPGTDIYTQWPAVFVTSAWFCNLTGLDPMTLAHLFALLIHVLIAVIVYSGARLIGQPPITALMAVFIAEIANWVGQDYFAPQAWTIMLAFGFLVLMLASRGAPQAGVLAIIPFAAIVPSHQLTPFWLVGAVVLLAIFRYARPRWAIAAMIAIVGCYLLLNLQAVAPYGIFSGGNPVANAASNMPMSGVPAKSHTSMVCRGLSAGVMLAAAASAVWGLRRKHRHVLSCSIIAFCSLGLLVAQGYGGEAIFRVYLYGLLGCALLIAPAMIALLDRWRAGPLGKLTAGAAAGGLLAASLAGLYSFYALWPIVVETRAQVTTISRLVDEAEPGSRFMMMAASGMPFRGTAHYAAMTLANPYWDDPLELEYGARQDLFPNDEQLGYLNWRASQLDYPSYVLFTPQSDRRMEYYGTFAPDADDRFAAVLDADAHWQKIYDDDGTVVFRFDPEQN